MKYRRPCDQSIARLVLRLNLRLVPGEPEPAQVAIHRDNTSLTGVGRDHAAVVMATTRLRARQAGWRQTGPLRLATR